MAALQALLLEDADGGYGSDKRPQRQKYRERLRRPLAVTKRPSTTILGDCYGTVLFWKPQLALLVNERTLMPILLPLA